MSRSDLHLHLLSLISQYGSVDVLRALANAMTFVADNSREYNYTLAIGATMVDDIANQINSALH